MIEAKNVVKSFDGFRALDGLTMTVPHGSIYGLVGPNGAGKSTLLRHVTGVYRQDSGSVLIEGNPVYENPAAKARIASIPDELYYFLSASTRDMMRFYRGFYPRFDVKRYEALKDVFTTIPEKQPIRRLSKGMQKQSAFWLALCCRPDILVLDEPVDGLDPVMRRQVWSLLMGDVADHGTTVLVSSHNLRELEDICDHVGLLHKGGILLSRELDDMKLNIHKLQCVLQPGMSAEDLVALDKLNIEQRGSLITLVVRGTREEVEAIMASYNPVFFECIPLSLEEIFISETEVAGYDIKKLIF